MRARKNKMEKPKQAPRLQTTEVDLNYVIKQHNARLMIFYIDTRFDAVKTNDKKFGVGMQLQM